VHPQRNNPRISGGASWTSDGTVRGISLLFASSRIQWYWVASKGDGSGWRQDFQMAAWICARLTFSLNASLVGGRDFSSGAEVVLTDFSRPNLYTNVRHVFSCLDIDTITCGSELGCLYHHIIYRNLKVPQEF